MNFTCFMRKLREDKYWNKYPHFKYYHSDKTGINFEGQ